MFDDNVYVHWQGAGETKSYIMTQRHIEGGKSKQLIEWKKTLHRADGKTNQFPTDSIETTRITLRRCAP